MLSARLSPSPRVKRRKQADKSQQRRQGVVSWSGSIGQELEQLAQERTIHTDPRETRRRRTLRLVRQDSHSCWGFTLQTYGIRHKQTGEMEVMTYVDYVEIGSAAWIAGMRKGDVVLSVNGDSVEGLTHHTLVTKIQSGHDVLRLVVLFEDCCRKVELYERFIKLKRILAQKKRELCQLDHQERVLCSGGLLSPVGFSRGSVRSSTSSDWDRYSELGSPTTPATPEPSGSRRQPGYLATPQP
ncbi:protein TAMALIN-like [Babylonia areolata]|uniref:protein TAMALIN-like n=1 Tax=Babylonia areolata TaxID=304850 RepID=UPI003FD1A023